MEGASALALPEWSASNAEPRAALCATVGEEAGDFQGEDVEVAVVAAVVLEVEALSTLVAVKVSP